MKRKNTTRNALVTSIISLLLCVSMLVGTTFAWFTDEVVTGMNTIAAGNLDIELYHTNAKVNDEKIAAATDLFLDVNGNAILWEPGVVSYENIEIANVGSLALQYRLTLDIFNENNLNGHKLSEVLKVVLLDKTIPAGATRAEVMALATAALDDPEYTLDGKLTHLVEQGELYPDGSTEGESTITGALVIFWEPNDNEIDNLYNANNGQVTSDRKPLHIDFGVHLEATQLMYEEDSFGNNYDQFTGFNPMPAVDGYDPEISYTDGIGGAVYTTVLDTAYQFRPTETYEQGKKSEYFNYFVDFVVSADRDVPADSIMLAGYYDAWCSTLNDNHWVGLIGGDVKAGEEIRLVRAMAGGAMDFQYKLLLEYGNDGLGFLCGAKDMTGANAGTTLTVKLNMYKAVLNDQGHYEETGEVETRGVFTYTFPAKEVASQAELEAALATGGEIKLVNDITLDKNVKIENDVVLDLNGHDFIAETGSRPFQVYGGDLTIYATGSNVALDKYGLVDIREGDVKVSIVGGTFAGELANGAVIKGRANSKAEIYLKDVNMSFTDTSAKGSYVYNPDSGASAVTTIDGGVYNIDCGFVGNVTMKNAIVNAKGFIFNGGGSVESCALTTDGTSKAPADAAPFCCVAASHNREVTVKNSTLTATNCNVIEIYPTGGIVTVTDSTVNGSCYKHPLYDDTNNCSITFHGVEQ
jgi:predicted ribosomally synthesized peptide with SipW-like signal peptide